MKKLNLLCTLVGVSTLASSCAIVTSCSSTAEVKSISVEMNNPVKYIGSTFTSNDLIVKAVYSDGTEKELKYTSSDNYQDGYDVSGIKMNHEFSHLDIGTHEITIIYKTFVKTVKFQVTQVLSASLVGSSEIGLSQSQVVVDQTFEANLIASKEGTITVNKVTVNGSALSEGQYTFQNNKITVDGQYVTGSIIIFATFAEQSESKPVGITAITAGTFALEMVGDQVDLPDLSYSNNGGSSWSTYEKGAKIPMTAGSTLLLKGNNPKCWSKNIVLNNSYVSNNYIKFNIDFDFNLSGNLISLLDNNEGLISRIIENGCFANLFKGVTGLKSIDKNFFKGIKTLSPNCFNGMFNSCTGLTDISDLELPAEEAADGCYAFMFADCTGLVKSPKILPATNVGTNCYKNMFSGCTLLEDMPELPATYLNGSGCYANMFSGCSALKNVYDLPATNSTTACYLCMFRECTSLETAPAIAMDYAIDTCCRNMFNGCTSLKTPAMMLSLKGLKDGVSYNCACFHHMYDGCTSMKVGRNDASYGTKFMTIPKGSNRYDAVNSMFGGTIGSFDQGTPDDNDVMYFTLD